MQPLWSLGANHSQPVANASTSNHLKQAEPGNHNMRAHVRRYSRPALDVDFGFVALASLRLTSGGLRREHARAANDPWARMPVECQNLGPPRATCRLQAEPNLRTRKCRDETGPEKEMRALSIEGLA